MSRISFGSVPTGVTVLTVSKFNERVIDRLNDLSHLAKLGFFYSLPRYEA
jgi:hypothetical protein